MKHIIYDRQEGILLSKNNQGCFKEWPNTSHIQKRSTLKTSERPLGTWNLSRTSEKPRRFRGRFLKGSRFPKVFHNTSISFKNSRKLQLVLLHQRHCCCDGQSSSGNITSMMMSSHVASDMQSISCYERLRLQNIERNQKFLKELGLEITIVTAPVLKPSRPKRKIDVEVDYI